MTFKSIQPRLNVDATSYNVVSTSMQRHDDVASTFIRHCISVMYPLGNEFLIQLNLVISNTDNSTAYVKLNNDNIGLVFHGCLTLQLLLFQTTVISNQHS